MIEETECEVMNKRRVALLTIPHLSAPPPPPFSYDMLNSENSLSFRQLGRTESISYSPRPIGVIRVFP